MKILYLCGVFAKENQEEIQETAKRPVEYSANLFQEKMIAGFTAVYGEDVSVLSAPFIGSYPNASSKLFFKAFREEQSLCRYVPFCNIWGIRNPSRARSLKKAIKDFIRVDDEEKFIVIYSPHTPLLEAAVYAKKKDPRIRTCLVIPDVPQYMNLNDKISLLYKVAKKYDILAFNRLNKKMDSYMLLTEPMREMVDTANKPYTVVEGIVEDDIFVQNEEKRERLRVPTEEKYIVYTGKMQERFGVKNLVEAFLLLPDPEYRLILCGRGDLDDFIREKAKEDPRIRPLGQVTPEVAHEWVIRAHVLVNPRQGNEAFTRYSFPSKNIEYLASGNPVVAYFLDGMKPVYKDFILSPENDSAESLAECLKNAPDPENYENTFREYAKELTGVHIAEKLVEMTFPKKETK